MDIKPGYLTTEFWAAGAAVVWAVFGSVLARHGITSDQVTLVSTRASSFIAAVYIAARTWLKRGTPTPPTGA